MVRGSAWIGFGSMFFSASLLACAGGGGNAGPGTDGGATLPGPDAGTPAAAALGCLGVLQCVTSRSCTADACVDACMAKGSAQAKEQVTDLATCYQNAGCQDSACLQTNCKTELDTCIGGSAPTPTGTPLQTSSAPPGNVPPDFVGKWTAGDSFALGDEKEFVFNADGSGEYIVAYTGTIGSCESTIMEKYIGSAVIDPNASTITIYATDVQQTTAACGIPATKPDQTKTLSFAYVSGNMPNEVSFMITDTDCAAQYSGDEASANLYCRYTYYKQ